jgi:hypothetical protein
MSCCGGNTENYDRPKNLGGIALDLMSAVADIAKRDFCDDAERMFRLKQCQGCHHRVNNDLPQGRDDNRIEVTDTCMMCKCFIRAKSKLKNQSCPQGKWVLPKTTTAIATETDNS